MRSKTDSTSPPDKDPERGEWHVVRTLAADTNSEGSSDASPGASSGGFGRPEDFAFEALIGECVVAVFRHEGHWYAIDAMCAHQGGPLAQGLVRDGCVTCPWHGWQYDLATGIQTINRQPLQQSYPVRQTGDRVEVFL